MISLDLSGRKMNFQEASTEKAEGLELKQLAQLLVFSWVCNVFNILVLGVWMAICFITIMAYLRGRMDRVWYCIAASPAMEIWGRMSLAPLVPMEMGKYFLLLAITIIIVHRLNNSSYPEAHSAGKILFVIILPTIVISLATFNYEMWVFNGLGIIELILLLILAANERWGLERYCRTLQYALLPIIPAIMYSTLKTVSYENVDFRLNANSTGGFGSNQVSTVFGVGIVLTTLLLILGRPLIKWKLLNFLLIGYLLFKGLLTFSRGGILVAAVAVIIALIPSMLANLKAFVRYSFTMILLGIIGYGVFNTVNSMTDNMLLQRYQGETGGTLDRTKEKTLNSITSGRADIFISDMQIFEDNPIFGVGIGQSKEERVKYGYEPVIAHVEFSRLVSEHGIAGICVAAGLVLFAVTWSFRQRMNVWKGITASLFALALLTSFHAAMRTNTSSVFYALASIPVYFYKRKEGAGT